MAPKSAKRRIVVDGSNIATEGRSAPSLAQLDEAIRTFLDEHRGFGPSDVTVVVDATFGHRIDHSERHAFEQALEHGEMVTPPAGAIGRGDGFILRIAEKSNALVLSNDSFQEFHSERPWLFEPGRLIGGKPVPGVGWVFTPRTPVRGPRSRVATARPAQLAGDAAVSSTVSITTTTRRRTRSANALKSSKAVKAEPAKVEKAASAKPEKDSKPQKAAKSAKSAKAAEAARPVRVVESPPATKVTKAAKPAKAKKARKTAKAVKAVVKRVTSAVKPAKAAKAAKPAKAVQVVKAPKAAKLTGRAADVASDGATRRAKKATALVGSKKSGTERAVTGKAGKAGSARAAKKAVDNAAATSKGGAKKAAKGTSGAKAAKAGKAGAPAKVAASAKSGGGKAAPSGRAAVGGDGATAAGSTTLNDPMTFLTFVADHPVGSTVEGTVVSFTSHGAHIAVGDMICHVPLRGLGRPSPTRARQVLAKGETRRFVLVSLDATHRRAELALPGIAR